MSMGVRLFRARLSRVAAPRGWIGGRPMCAPWPCDGHRVANPSRDRSEAEGAEAAGVSMGVRLFRARLSRVTDWGPAHVRPGPAMVIA